MWKQIHPPLFLLALLFRGKKYQCQLKPKTEAVSFAGLPWSYRHWGKTEFCMWPFKKGKFQSVEILSQVNHHMEVNNAAHYKSVWQLVSKYAWTFWNIVKAVRSGKLSVFLIRNVTHKVNWEYSLHLWATVPRTVIFLQISFLWTCLLNVLDLNT